MKHADAYGIYSTQATVRTYESGADGLMKPETVLHWFQEIAEAHASSLGFGYDFVMSRGLAWVEVRLNTAISRLPRWKETVELRTWTAQETPLLARRNLEIRDALGKRRLLALEESMEQELDWVRAFYVTRMQAEGLMDRE